MSTEQLDIDPQESLFEQSSDKTGIKVMDVSTAMTRGPTHSNFANEWGTRL